MNAGDWIAIASPGLLVGGAILAATVKMTRLLDAVERLEAAMSKVAGRVQDHEIRLTKGGL